jgi:hypothetical protein
MADAEQTSPNPRNDNASRVTASNLGSALALSVSVFALALGAYQTRLMQSQARASVWPYLTIGYTYSNNVDKDGYILNVDNNGVGPARVETVVVRVDGKPMKHWDDVLAALGVPPPRPAMATTTLAGDVIPPNLNRETTIQAIRVNDRDVAAKFKAAEQRLAIDICYCSVYDECWTAHWQQSRAESVERCEAQGLVQFEQ